jgi:hypothetical protein
MPEKAADWIPEITVAISMILAVPALGSFIHTLSKDRGREAKRIRIIDAANGRMNFWKSRLEVQLKVLSATKLESVKKEAETAIEKIRFAADLKLERLHHTRRSRVGFAVRPIGVNMWRKVLLLYRPVLIASKPLAYLTRAIYLYSLAFTILSVYCLMVLEIGGLVPSYAYVVTYAPKFLQGWSPGFMANPRVYWVALVCFSLINTFLYRAMILRESYPMFMRGTPRDPPHRI